MPTTPRPGPQLRLPAELVARIDRRRGRVPRTSYVAGLLEWALASAPVACTCGRGAPHAPDCAVALAVIDHDDPAMHEGRPR
jgi:hypothetical protein